MIAASLLILSNDPRQVYYRLGDSTRFFGEVEPDSGGVGVGARSATAEVTTTKRTNYFPHGVRLSVWANQMNMARQEAMPEIEKRVKKVASIMLPR